VSVAVDAPLPNGEFVQRATIGFLTAWDPASRLSVKLPPGIILHSCRLLRLQTPPNYRVEFEVDERTYQCPLYGFQPRTEVLIESPPGA
jgi:hypothetical protein